MIQGNPGTAGQPGQAGLPGEPGERGERGDPGDDGQPGQSVSEVFSLRFSGQTSLFLFLSLSSLSFRDQLVCLVSLEIRVQKVKRSVSKTR